MTVSETEHFIQLNRRRLMKGKLHLFEKRYRQKLTSLEYKQGFEDALWLVLYHEIKERENKL